MSEKAKHTPGPWEVIPQHGAGPMIARRYETGKQMSPTGLRLVCHVLQRGSSLQQDVANSRLIAAAPELLEAGERLITEGDCYGKWADTHSCLSMSDDKADWCGYCSLRAAIAKAKGEG